MASVRVRRLTETVYNSTDDVNPVEFTEEDGTVLPLNLLTKATVLLPDFGTIDSSVDVGSIDFATSGALGILIFDFSDLSIPVGEYNSTVRIFDVSHPDGQTIVHPNSETAPKLIFSVVA